ncbi:MAG: hypothetical protein ACX93T_00415 [Bacteroidota bacterium]
MLKCNIMQARALGFTIVYTGLLGLCQGACNHATGTEKDAHTTSQDKGSHVHTKTEHSTATAKQNGEKKRGTKQEEVTTADTNATTSHNPAPSIQLKRKSSIHPEQPNPTPQNTTVVPPNAGHVHEPSTVSNFTVKLNDATPQNGVRNFVLVNIRPSAQGMSLHDFFVTTTLTTPRGRAMGSKRRTKQGGFIYDQPLTNCCIGTLLLTKVNWLGGDHTRFTKGQEIGFKIEVNPGATIRIGEPYTLTVTIACQSKSPYTITQRIMLTKLPPSPRKARKHAKSQQTKND